MANDKNKKNKNWPKIIAIILIVLIAVAGIGTFLYLKAVKKGSEAATKVIFEYAYDLNVDDTVDRTVPDKYKDLVNSFLDDDFKESFNIKKHLKEEFSAKIAEYKLSGILTDEVVDQCVDIVLEDMVSRAEYKIVDVDASFKHSTVTVTTSNIDYCDLAKQMVESIKADITNPNSELWAQSGNVINAAIDMILNGGSNKAVTDAIVNGLNNYYQAQKDKCTVQEYTGKIEYAIVDGQWTIKDMDNELFVRFYGFNSDEVDLFFSDFDNEVTDASTEAAAESTQASTAK